MLVEAQKRVGGNTRVHDVLAIVAGIVPALGAVEGAAPARGGAMERNIVVEVARAAFPLARILFFQGHGGSLVVEPLQQGLRHVAEGIVSNFQVLADLLPVHLDGVRSGSLKFGEIDELHALAATVPVRGGGRRHREHRLAGLVDKFDVSAALKQREFLEVAGAVANLVDVGGRGERNTGHGEDGRCGQKPGFHDLLHKLLSN